MRRRVKVRATYEIIAALLGVDDDLEVDHIESIPNRRIADIYLSHEATDTPREGRIRTFDHVESQEIIQDTIDMTTEQMIERMREMVQTWDEQHRQEDERAQSREAMNTLYGQLRGNRDGDDNTGH